MLEWLNKTIEEQKVNTDIINFVCNPHTAAELQEKKENGEFE